ncbi:hypothetical protein LTR56_008162 [Elasticomyces elasticus]|nr:hypothetical protein LTR56_008162 [Elasticomyces elasticus]KAK3662914.1 hypothetical protein LTR22_006317 [Elasticomyces elasticus]KAK4930109.1 hypothetical protein LTR49_003437 [Elasticomyces elasticus]KAK5763509.1 hypothetical protein LTS12_006280 [Elasticomyces elasticus]
MSAMQYIDPASGSAVYPSDATIQGADIAIPVLERATTERPSRSPNRSSTRHHQPRIPSAARTEMISLEEYAALPPSIQKKYFSPAERLRIVQESAAQQRKRQRRKQTWLSSTSSTSSSGRSELSREHEPSPSPSSDDPHSSRMQGQPKNKDRATWFRQPQSSRLKGCDKRQVDSETTQPPSHRSPLPDNHDAPELCQLPSASLQPNITTSEKRLDLDIARRGTNDTTADTSISSSQFQKHGCAPPSDNSLPPACRSAQPSPPITKRLTIVRPKRKSMHRALTLVPLALPPPTLTPLSEATPSPVQPALVAARLSRPYLDHMVVPANRWPHSASSQIPGSHRQSHPGFAHGFDVTFEPDHCLESIPSSPSTDASFLIQGASSLDSLDEDDASLHTDTPEPTSHERKVAQSASFDSGIVLPLQMNHAEGVGRSRRSSNLSGREMALRLTRLEVRTPEEELYRWQRTQTSGVSVADADPLALAPLVISLELDGRCGAFAAQSGSQPRGLGRVWNSIRRH